MGELRFSLCYSRRRQWFGKWLEYLSFFGFDTQRGHMSSGDERNHSMHRKEKTNWNFSFVVHESSLEQISRSKKNPPTRT